MKLFYRKYGKGQPLFILHGLFGQSDNWNTLAKQFSEQGFEVYTIDQRNHGLSPHSTTWDYHSMSTDIEELMGDLLLDKCILLGHSMGGKTAMQFAVEHPHLLDKLIVADMAPKYYPPHHQAVIQGLQAIDFKTIKNRKEAEDTLSQYIEDTGTKQFLLKNIFWKDDGIMDWRFNLNVIAEQIENMGESIQTDHPCEVPALFIRGEKSLYIEDSDLNSIKDIFPRSYVETIKDAGHWVHAEQPQLFFKAVLDFIK
ncbi:MAG TPA: alpha/beta fold hydrolase [Bacteroidia bacterium]|jgi:pimeloyl-ACP methyl ester carboxylesterase|nr:alpha/beta fold hydrolase [Bacteroidia bacterium]HRG52803.1 alpha/beta fold hydrolase [Bacteroidia bacterium]